MPSQENLNKIISEIQNNIYENYSLNFIDIIKENYLQDFLTKIIKTGQINKIYNLNFFPINFKVYHSNIFDLNFSSAYNILNQKNCLEKENDEFIQKTSKGIFSILYHMKIIPKIVYPKNDFTESIVLKSKIEFESTFHKFPEIKN